MDKKQKTSRHNKLRRILLLCYGVLILLASPIMIKAFLKSSDWVERLLWGLAVLFGIPSAIFCLLIARKGSDGEVNQALKDLNSD
jgi:hypothetical protein